MHSFSHFSANVPPATTPASSQPRHRQRQAQPWSTSLPSQPVTAWLKRLGQWLLQGITDSEQVRIWTKITPNGLEWHAYDPKCQRSFAGYSEAGLRTWLEQRYRSS